MNDSLQTACLVVEGARELFVRFQFDALQSPVVIFREYAFESITLFRDDRRKLLHLPVRKSDGNLPATNEWMLLRLRRACPSEFARSKFGVLGIFECVLALKVFCLVVPGDLNVHGAGESLGLKREMESRHLVLYFDLVDLDRLAVHFDLSRDTVSRLEEPKS